MDGANGAGIGETDRGADEVIDTEFVVACSADEIFVRRVEHREVHCVGRLDARNHERARAIRFLKIYRKTEVDMRGSDHGGLAVDLGERVVHRWLRCDCLDDRKTDDVGERHLAATSTREMAIDHVAIVGEEFGGHRAHAGGSWHTEAGFHVVYETCCRTTHDRGRCLYWCGCRRGDGCSSCRRSRCSYRGGGRCGCRCGCGRGSFRRNRRIAWDVVCEEVPPRRIHAVAIGEELLVDLVYEPFIGSEGGKPVCSVRSHGIRLIAAARVAHAVVATIDLIKRMREHGR